MSIVLVDFSQMCIAAVAAQAEDIKGESATDMIKHVVLNMLLSLKTRFKSKMILCCDSRNYWRKDILSSYKGHRKHLKDKSFLDFDLVHTVVNELKIELAENFPYPVLEIPRAEADDIIAILCEYFQENELETTGLFEDSQDVIICSTDGDFAQLQKFNNTRQWNNIKKEFIKCSNVKEFLIEHIISGDNSDNVPSIMSTNEWSDNRANNIKGPRAKPFMKIRLPLFYEKGIDACDNDLERKHYLRNESLIDLSKIPDLIKDNIINTYKSTVIKGNHAKIMSYMTQHRMKLLIGHVYNF